MKKIHLGFCLSFLLNCVVFYAQQSTINIVPSPVYVQTGEGSFAITCSTKIYSSQVGMPAAFFLSSLLKQSTGYNFVPVRMTNLVSQKGIILQTVKDFSDTTEGAYQLTVTPYSIIATAADNTGLFYAVQSIRQLLPAAIESKTVVKNVSWTVPAVQIKDAPRFAWRGYMKDVSRTFYSVDVIKKYLDVMALYKMNVFHLHLTDDQGWRIQIKSHPELTSKKATIFGESSNQPAYRSGFYTQQQIKDIVAYASLRHITVVPEVDVPGHCWPVVITNPQLATNKNLTPDYVVSFMDSYNYWGHQFTPNPLDPTKESVYTFLNDVFTEIAALFPGKYIHFGGDEVRHRFWENVPHIEAFMKVHGMTKVTDLQSYFVTRVAKIITDKGKSPIGWNDIMEIEDVKTLPAGTAIMSWTGSDAVKNAAKYGFKVVASPTGPFYFDISQSDISDGTMADWNYGGGTGEKEGGNTLKNVYTYDPEKGLSNMESKYLLGVQANMWPAVPQEVKDINVQNFPRLLAVAETGWTPAIKKDYSDFLYRLSHHYSRLDSLRVDYYKKGGYIIATWQPSQVSTDYTTVQWDVTNKVYTTGRAQAGFFYTSGQSFLKVMNVKLLENGKEVAADLHTSLADKHRATPFKKDMFLYILELKKYDPTAVYILQADIAGATGNDTKGNITFNLSPYKPFSAVEPNKH